MNTPSLGTAYGVYGLKIRGLDGARRLMSTQSPNAPVVDVLVSIGQSSVQATNTEARIVHHLIGGGSAELLRASNVAHLTLPHQVSDEEVLHPWFASGAAAFCAWQGRNVLHGGVVCLGDNAIALVGEREAGKSSTLAWLALHSPLDVLSDDLAVIDDDKNVYSGPACIDLRPPTADFLGAWGSTLVRENSRERLELATGPDRAKLRAIVLLAWGEAVDLRPLNAVERLPLLVPHAEIGSRLEARERFLDLLTTPMFVLTRPRRWDALQTAATQLEQILDNG